MKNYFELQSRQALLLICLLFSFSPLLSQNQDNFMSKAWKAYKDYKFDDVLSYLDKAIENNGETNVDIEFLYSDIYIRRYNKYGTWHKDLPKHLKSFGELTDPSHGQNKWIMTELEWDNVKKAKLKRLYKELPELFKENEEERVRKRKKDIDFFLFYPQEPESDKAWEETIAFLKGYLKEYEYHYDNNNEEYYDIYENTKYYIRNDTLYVNTYEFSHHKPDPKRRIRNTKQKEYEYVRAYPLKDLKNISQSLESLGIELYGETGVATRVCKRTQSEWDKDFIILSSETSLKIDSSYLNDEAINAFHHLAYLARKERLDEFLTRNPGYGSPENIRIRKEEHKRDSLVTIAKKYMKELNITQPIYHSEEYLKKKIEALKNTFTYKVKWKDGVFEVWIDGSFMHQRKYDINGTFISEESINLLNMIDVTTFNMGDFLFRFSDQKKEFLLRYTHTYFYDEYGEALKELYEIEKLNKENYIGKIMSLYPESF